MRKREETIRVVTFIHAVHVPLHFASLITMYMHVVESNKRKYMYKHAF